jgi:hypothetical protein
MPGVIVNENAYRELHASFKDRRRERTTWYRTIAEGYPGVLEALTPRYREIQEIYVSFRSVSIFRST